LSLRMYRAAVSSDGMPMMTPKESAKDISQSPSREKAGSQQYSEQSEAGEIPNDLEQLRVESNSITDAKQPTDSVEKLSANTTDVQLSRQTSNAEPKTLTNPQMSRKSLATDRSISNGVAKNGTENYPKDPKQDEIQDKIAPLSKRSDGSGSHSINVRSSKKQFGQPIRVSFADSDNLITRASPLKSNLKKPITIFAVESEIKIPQSNQRSGRSILIKEDSYARDKRVSCNQYTCFLTMASKNISQIVKNMAAALATPKAIIIDDDDYSKNDLAEADRPNLQRCELNQVHAESTVRRHRDSLKLSRCASMTKSMKRKQEVDECLHQSRNPEQGEIDNNSDNGNLISNFKSVENLKLTKSCIYAAKSRENLYKPTVSFILPSNEPQKKLPMSYQDISSKNRPLVSPTRFPGKKASQFNKKSSLHKIEEAFLNMQGNIQLEGAIKPNDNNKLSQQKDPRINEDVAEELSDYERGLQRSEANKNNNPDFEASLRESSRENTRSNKKTNLNTSELTKAKQATELILKINLEKQARHTKMERRQQHELLKYQKQVLESQKMATEPDQNDIPNSRLEKVLENMKNIQKRTEDRRRVNSKSNQLMKRVQETAASFYEKPSTIELAEEQRRVIILEKIKSQHRPIDVNEFNQHQKLYEECALLMRAEFASKRKVVPERLGETEDKPHSNDVIRRIVERETEIEAQNREVTQLIKRKNQILESVGIEFKRSKPTQERVGQSHQENTTQNGAEGAFGNLPSGPMTISKAVPIKQYSSRLKQTIASSLQISANEQPELIRSNVDNRLPAINEPQNPSSLGKQSFYFNSDVYEAHGMKQSIEQSQLAKSHNFKSNIVNPQRHADSRFKENRQNPVKASSRAPVQPIDKAQNTATSMENKTTLPKIKHGITRKAKPDPLNPWNSIK
jgi:hypothetical protein